MFDFKQLNQLTTTAENTLLEPFPLSYTNLQVKKIYMTILYKVYGKFSITPEDKFKDQ